MTKPHHKTEAYKEVTELNKVYDELNSIHKKIESLMNKISHMATEKEAECRMEKEELGGSSEPYSHEEFKEGWILANDIFDAFNYPFYMPREKPFLMGQVREALESISKKPRMDWFYDYLLTLMYERRNINIERENKVEDE
jgi:hypothetical protein